MIIGLFHYSKVRGNFLAGLAAAAHNGAESRVNKESRLRLFFISAGNEEITSE